MISSLTPLSAGDRLKIFQERYTMATLNISEEEVLKKRMVGMSIKQSWLRSWKFNKNSKSYKK